MGVQKVLHRVGFAVVISAVAVACSSSAASPTAKHSPAASPTASARATARPTDTPWPTAQITEAPTESATAVPTDSAVETPAPAPAGWKTYTDTTLGIRFSYPPTWAATTSAGYPAVSNSDASNLVLWTTQPAGGLSLDSYKPIDLESMGAAPDNQGVISIGGVLGWGADWHVTKSGKALYVIDCFTVRNDTTVDFMWMSVPGTEAADSPLFHQIESTLVFTK